MRLEQCRFNGSAGWEVQNSSLLNTDRPAIVFIFASPAFIHDEAALKSLRAQYPDALMVGGSTAGNVLSVTSTDHDMVATAAAFDDTRVRLASLNLQEVPDLKSGVEQAVQPLIDEDLRHVMVFSDGLQVNGSELAAGLNQALNVPVSGGLMGDNGSFEKTWVIADGAPVSNQIALVGFYGERISIGGGCFAGWEEFGINRVVTRSDGNVVYEIDNQPALTLYKKYLGEFADGLPGTGLRFPLSIPGENGQMLIRTLLGIDENEQSLIFAGDIPEGTTTLLMRGSTDNLVDGATVAAQQAVGQVMGRDTEPAGDRLAVVISCVGRRMVMGQMADDELDAISDVLGDATRLAGFYSYGELASLAGKPAHCSLHNQTMTLVTMCES